MDTEFRQGERETYTRYSCTECGRCAEGNYSWADGSGEICDTCVEEDEKK